MPKRVRNAESYYYKEGSRYECLRKGIGVGMHKNKKVPTNSLQNIKYVGKVFEANFKRKRVKTVTQLIKYAKSHSLTQIRNLLQKVFTKTSGGVDKRGYNSTLIYLYRHGNSDIPRCMRISV